MNGRIDGRNGLVVVHLVAGLATIVFEWTQRALGSNEIARSKVCESQSEFELPFSLPLSGSSVGIGTTGGRVQLADIRRARAPFVSYHGRESHCKRSKQVDGKIV